MTVINCNTERIREKNRAGHVTRLSDNWWTVWTTQTVPKKEGKTKSEMVRYNGTSVRLNF